MVVATTGLMTAGVVQGMAERVSAVRSELSGLEGAVRGAVNGKAVHQNCTWTVAALRTAIRAVKKDLLALECRSADAQAVAS